MGGNNNSYKIVSATYRTLLFSFSRAIKTAMQEFFISDEVNFLLMKFIKKAYSCFQFASIKVLIKVKIKFCFLLHLVLYDLGLHFYLILGLIYLSVLSCRLYILEMVKSFLIGRVRILCSLHIFIIACFVEILYGISNCN